jgi:hypothetical protein
MGVRERKRREEGKCHAASITDAAPNLDPIVVFIVRLFAAASMADDRIASTNGAVPQDGLGALFGPVDFKLALRGEKWDK